MNASSVFPSRFDRDGSSEFYRQARHEKRATITASILASLNFLTGVVSLCVFYFVVPRVKGYLDDYGTMLNSMAVVAIQLSDLVVNYWYLFGPLAVAVSICDYFVLRWVGIESGLRRAIACGICISFVMLANLGVACYFLLTALWKLHEDLS